MEVLQFALIGSNIKKRISSRKRLIKTFSFLVVANVIVAALGLTTRVYIANTLGKEFFGQMAFALAIGTFGQVLIRVGLERTLVRDLIHYPDRFDDLVRASLYLRYALAALLLCGLLIWKLIGQNSLAGWGVVLIAMGSSMLALDLQPVYDVWHKMERHTVYFLIQKAGYLLLVWGAILSLRNYFSVFWIGAAMMISVVIYLCLQHRWAFKRMGKNPEKSFRYIFEDIFWLMRHNWLIWLTAMAGLAIVMLNQVVLKEYFGFAELGIYAAAWQFVMAGILLVEQVSRIGRPAMARLTRPEVSRHERERFMLGYAAVMVGVVIPFVVLMVFFPVVIVTTLFRPEYSGAASILPILSGYLFLVSLSMVVSQYVLSARLEKAYFYSMMTGGVLSIGLCPMLIRGYGIRGAAYVLLIAQGAIMVAFCVSTYMHLRRCA